MLLHGCTAGQRLPQRYPQRLPCQQRTLDPHRILPHPFERFQIAYIQLRVHLVRAIRQQPVDGPVPAPHFRDRFPLDRLGHHGRGGLTDGAATSLEGDGLDMVIV